MNTIDRSNNLVDMEYVSKCEEYTAYIDEHVANVKAAFEKLFRNPDKPFMKFHGIKGEKLEKILDKLEIAIICHDSSKYIDEEFDGYRSKFYPTSLEQERAKSDSFYASLLESRYNEAWFHHFTTNDHHPLHWKWFDIVDMAVPDLSATAEIPYKTEKQKVILKTPLEVAHPMKPIAILHMICDWEAMSIKFNSSTVDWYINKAVDERRAFNPATRKIVDELLTQLYGVDIPEICVGDPGHIDMRMQNF